MLLKLEKVSEKDGKFGLAEWDRVMREHGIKKDRNIAGGENQYFGKQTSRHLKKEPPKCKKAIKV